MELWIEQMVITNHLLYCFIARQASVMLVKVLSLLCVSWPVRLSYKCHHAGVY